MASMAGFSAATAAGAYVMKRILVKENTRLRQVQGNLVVNPY
jgi:hypothetical protein